MASETSSPYDLLDLEAQLRQLRNFSWWLGSTTAFFAILGMAAGAYYGSSAMALVGLIVGLYSSGVWFAYGRLAKKELQRAIRWLSYGIVLGETSIALTYPMLGPTLALASLMPVILAMHYGETRSRRWILGATTASSIAVIVIWSRADSAFDVPAGFLAFYQVTSMWACIALSAFLCWPIRQWLNERFIAAATAKEAAEQQRARYEAFLASQYDAVIATDAAGLVTLLNTAAEQATGWTFDEVKGRHIAESFCFETEDARMGAEDYVARALATDKGFLDLKGVKLIARNHDKVWKVTISAAPILVGESKQGAIFTFRDLTKHLQSIERDQAAERMKVVERMAAGLAPEFAEACGSIKRLGQKLGQQVEMDHMPDIADIAELVRAGDKAAAMASQLLAIGGRQPGTPVTFDFGTFVEDIVAILPHTLGKDICLIREGARTNIGRIKADPDQLRHAIHQVVNYARDTMPVGGALSIETGSVFLQTASPSESQPDTGGAYVQLIIKDSGAGWNEKDVQHILEPFYAPAATRAAAPRAQTALNLSVVHGVVRQNGGFLSVHSKLRVGSTYTMLFKRVDVDEWLEATGARSETWDDPPFGGVDAAPSPSVIVQGIYMQSVPKPSEREH